MGFLHGLQQADKLQPLEVSWLDEGIFRCPYPHLKIAVLYLMEATPWPAIAPGQPHRVSVHSFGEQ